MTQRLNQAKILQVLRALQPLIGAVHDARVRFLDCRQLRPRKLASLSKFLKDLAALSHTADYTPFESQLKRRLIRAQHRLHGFQKAPGGPVYALKAQMPVVYHDIVERYDDAARALLRTLADVPAEKSEPLKPVSALRAPN